MMRAIASILTLTFLLTSCSLIKEVDLRKFSGTDYSGIGPQLTLVKLVDPYATERVLTAFSESNKGTIRFNRLLNGGRFYIEWNLRAGESYLVELSVGSTKEIRDSIPFYGESCLGGSDCRLNAVKKCHLSPGLLMYCGTKNFYDPLFSAARLKKLVKNVPMALNLFIMACNISRSACDIRKINVIVE